MDEIDFDDLLADAEQEGDMYDDSRDDYDREAEMAMEAEVSMWYPLHSADYPAST